jgi:glycosyltransferase involved in cell wall biosynthesis
MRILLIGNYLTDRQESMQRFAALMLKGLGDAGHSVQLIQPPPMIGRLRPSANGLGKWLGYIDKLVLFPLGMQKAVKHADIVHICDHSNAFYRRFLGDKPCIVTCHDLLGVKTALGEIAKERTRWMGRQYQQLVLGGLRSCDHIVCDSEATRTDVIRIIGSNTPRMSVVYPSFNRAFPPMHPADAHARVRQLGIDPTLPIILHVGCNQWYKNRLGVIRIFEGVARNMPLSNFVLVMVGRPFTREMRQFVAERGLVGVVFEQIDLSDDDLRSLYSVAKLLLFPSLAEGFGWPIIEAQVCGCPVATSNRPPMTEVAGDAAIYLDPEDSEAASATLLCQLSRLDELRPAGFRNASRFEAAAMIESYVNVYKTLVQETYARSALKAAS